jgi:proteasome lid subunit RPN8/RPN11
VLVIIEKNALQFIFNHARSTYPEECCGFLLGADSGVRRIDQVLPAQNSTNDSPKNRYNIAPKELMHADEEARKLRLDLIGIYHSHPNAPAQPSLVDLEHAWPWYIYLVLSVHNGEPRDLTAWSLNEDRSRFNREDLKIRWQVNQSS